MTTNNVYEKELKIAISAVKKSEKTFRKYFGTKTQVQKKNGNYRDLVSYADHKIETEIKSYLKKTFPAYGFIGEEKGSTNSKAQFVWALDPVDGTTNFLQGLPECAISLALLRKGKPVVGVVSAPLLHRFYTARLGGGAYLNKNPIRVSRTSEIKMGFGTIGWGRDINFAVKTIPKFLPKIRKFRVFGSSSVNLCYLAQGGFDFYIAGHMSVWDYAAGQIILEEAGGQLLISQKPKLQIAGNKILVKKLRRLII